LVVDEPVYQRQTLAHILINVIGSMNSIGTC